MRVMLKNYCLHALLVMLMIGAATTAHAADQALPTTIQATKTLTYCSSISAPPMEFMSVSQTPEGADIDIGTELAKRMGLSVKWINVPFAGLVPDLLAGHCDAIISQLYVKPARTAVIDMVPYMNSQETIMELAHKPLFQNPNELSGLKVASVTGTNETILIQQASDVLIKAWKKGIDSVTFPDNTSALQQLQFGQVDAYATPYEIGARPI
jgi:polar amino acid transport system substrate-binding protein